MMQHIKKGNFVGEVNFEIFDVLELFPSFKMTPHLSKLIKAFKFYICKRIKNSE